MAGSEFDKDFGYLMPFLDKVAAAASGVSNQAAREELARLVEGEKERWTQIRNLLSGDGGESASPAPSKANEPEAVSQEKQKSASTSPPPLKANEPEAISEEKEKPNDEAAAEEEKSSTQPLSGKEATAQPSLQFTVGSLRPRKH